MTDKETQSSDMNAKPADISIPKEIEDQASFLEAMKSSMPEELRNKFFPEQKGYALESYKMYFIDE